MKLHAYIYIYIYLLAIAGQTAGPNFLENPWVSQGLHRLKE